MYQLVEVLHSGNFDYIGGPKGSWSEVWTDFKRMKELFPVKTFHIIT